MMPQLNVSKWFWITVKVACSVAFICQISASINRQLTREKKVAKTVTKELKDVDFPATFKVCMKPSFNVPELLKVGYDSGYSYFKGQSRFDYTGTGNHGWAGHTEDGDVFSNVSDVQNRVFQDYHSVINTTLVFKTNGDLDLPSSSYQLLKPNFPNNCLTLDISKHLPPGDMITKLIMAFNSNQFATDIDVIIKDQLTLTDRSRKVDHGSQSIVFESLIRNISKFYWVSFYQNEYEDEDESVCVNYPTEKYVSFNDCERQYLDKLLAEETLLPAWATPGDLSKATTLSRWKSGSKSVYEYVFGYPGPCVQPCTQTSISAAYQSSDKIFDHPTIYFIFNPDVKVTTHALPVFQPIEVLQVGFA